MYQFKPLSINAFGLFFQKKFPKSWTGTTEAKQGTVKSLAVQTI